ncbi:MAG: hypothetical protein QNJ09_13545 [Paracoccaceae bacterium]|nr:hypothetical protein [Paracoccaceae bacterium]
MPVSVQDDCGFLADANNVRFDVLFMLLLEWSVSQRFAFAVGWRKYVFDHAALAWQLQLRQMAT